ncbi:barstar family protein [Paenibacillus aurantiacus]|uniref:Barstar family protein n=1 Tax=Paenibacillus aurantiacus TaxID=1936118 RepID=A0ABV5KPN0_9BACL
MTTSELILDGRTLTTVGDFHDLFQACLHFPGYYGRNLDALYDCLHDYAAPPLTIRWLHYDESVRLLGDRAHGIAQTLRDAASEINGLELIIEVPSD